MGDPQFPTLEYSEPSPEETLPYGLLEVKEVWDGHIFYFRDQAEADQAIKDFWAKVWSRTPDMFSRGMWRPSQHLTGGADYRTRPLTTSQISGEQREKGITTGFFIGGNEQAPSPKGLEALRELGLLRGA